MADKAHRILTVFRSMPQPIIFPGQPHPLMRLFNQHVQPIKVEGLADKIVGPEFHGRNSDIHITMACDHDHFSMGNGFPYLNEQIKPNHTRQPQIQQDDIKPVTAHLRQGSRPICSGMDLPAAIGQFFLEKPPDRLFIVNDQYAVRFRLHASCAPGRTT